MAFDLVTKLILCSSNSKKMVLPCPEARLSGVPYVRENIEERFGLVHNDDVQLRAPKTGDAASPASRVMFLKYQPGYVTTAPLTDNMTVITGRMSGCWIMKYTRNGADYVAHIGTSDNDPVLNTRAKTAWMDLVADATNPISNVIGFNPLRDFSGEILGGTLFAIVEPNGTFYNLDLSRKMNCPDYVVKALHTCPSSLPTPANIPTGWNTGSTMSFNYGNLGAEEDDAEREKDDDMVYHLKGLMNAFSRQVRKIEDLEDQVNSLAMSNRPRIPNMGISPKPRGKTKTSDSGRGKFWT